MSQINEEMNEYDGEYDFLTQEREAISARIQALIAARPAGVLRRVPLLAVADDVVTAAAHEFLGTPTNAMHYTPFFQPDEDVETNFQNQLAFAMLLTDRTDSLTEAEPNFNFMLASTTTTQDPEWMCVICREADGDIVYHPNNCHTFHRDCLNIAMLEDIRCPLCRVPAPQPHNMI
jgi:Ring finger domain